MQENVNLQALNTFGLSASARWFCDVHSESELEKALQFADEQSLPVFVLGGGSNIVLRADFPGLVLHMQMRGIQVVSKDQGVLHVEAACGENWHGFVSHCLAQGWFGLENLALIPGSVGAAPIQNIGAYGVEVSERIVSVTVFNTDSGKVETMTAQQCGFGYRDSVFKRQYKGRRIILGVVFRLHSTPEVNLGYAALRQALADNSAPLPADVFAAVCAIRRNRLPDPQVLGNAGSFFKNPVIARSRYSSLQKDYPEIPGHAVEAAGSSQVKVPAAWLIERAGWKGRRTGQAGVYEKQSLVLVNHGAASAQDILALAQAIRVDVGNLFGIALEPEVQWVPEGPLE